MTEAFPKKLSHLFRKIRLLQVSAFVIVAIFTVGTHELTSKRLADQLGRNMRRHLILGDMRPAMLIAADATNDQFVQIIYKPLRDENGFIEPQESNSAWDNFFSRTVTNDVKFDDSRPEKIGTITFRYSVLEDIWPLSGIFLGLLFILQILFRNSHSLLVKATENDLVAKRDAAIAKTTQMLSHDVRRPFSIVQSVLKCVLRAKTIEEARGVASNLQSVLTLSTQAVEGGLADILELGSKKTPTRTSISPRTLIEMAVNQTFCFRTNTNVQIFYNFSHHNTIAIDAQKFLRVFSNLMVNALEATNGITNFTFTTKQLPGNEFTEFRFRNTGSSIEVPDQKKIFEDFFTKGKNSGTGLGLAIVQKVVSDHGGVVRCESSIDEHWVEFIFTVPNSIEPDNSDLLPPTTSSEIEKRWQKQFSSEIGIEVNDSTLQIEDSFVRRCKLAGSKLRILVVDDEQVYFNAIKATVAAHPSIEKHVDFCYAKDDAEAISLARSHEPHLTICDLSFGSKIDKGVEIIKSLRTIGIKSLIALHSNSLDMEKVDEALKAGANVSIPKPLTYECFMELAHKASEGIGSDLIIANEFSVVDDEMSYRYLWVKYVKDAKVNVFATPEEFWDHANRCSNFLAKQKAIVTDFHFPKLSRFDGLSFAKELRAKGLKNIILSSNLGVAKQKWHDAFDAVIAKEPMSYSEIRSMT